MPDRTSRARGEPAAGRVAVIDVGSNSLRLVVFEPLGATLIPLLNEKVMCGLGRGLDASGRLNPAGVELAHSNLQRFVALARALEADHLAIIATAAVREALDGQAFAAEVERQTGVPVRIIDGAEEARLSAAGVLAGIPDAEGLVADLGGGSVELVAVDGGGWPAIRDGVTLPLGVLRLSELGDSRKKIVDTIERALAGAKTLGTARGRSLYLVGGAWRAIARLHMEQVRYPLHIIHHYTIRRRAAESFLEVIGGLSRRSLDRVSAVNRRRLELVPLAAMVVHRLVVASRPDRIVFSAFGLREGYAYGLLQGEPREDPLLAAAVAIAASQSRWHRDGDRLQQWTAPMFPNLDPNMRRLHRAACWLSDIAWTEHPDYRAEHAFTRALRMPVAAISHRERAFIALALHSRYGGTDDDPVKQALPHLLDEDSAAESASLGRALRLAYTLCGGALDLLAQTRLSRGSDGLILELPADGNLFTGEAVQRRLDALARSLGVSARTTRRRATERALA
jgi:exopolyphosphatase/guanosine-5'-triphosphate,3'-diphosphate pyrophosphatase